jgi:ubiquinone/menaquinone biosynthesis C-methylase UbiE
MEFMIQLAVAKRGDQLRKILLDHYYKNIYRRYLFESRTQSRGIKYFEYFVESCWGKKKSRVSNFDSILEIGAGQGEHWSYLREFPKKQYVALDLRELSDLTYLNSMGEEFRKKLKFKVGNAENLPFRDKQFDRVFTTCLLHHVDDPLSVLLEARRVTKAGGEIVFVMPTDPGLLNQLIKRVISYPELKKYSDYPPELFYALEHKNHVKGLLTLIEFVYQGDNKKYIYSPFKFRSWNLNFIIGIHIKVSKNPPNYIKSEEIKL